MSTSLVALSVEPQTVAVFSVEDNSAEFAKLAASLAELRKLKGVAGYILRNNSSAIIDLPKQMPIADFALLTYQISESTEEMAKQFNLADIESVVVEGKDLKVLCLAFGKNKVDLFMEKTAGHAWMVKRIHL